jgi:hypothetical protein
MRNSQQWKTTLPIFTALLAGSSKSEEFKTEFREQVNPKGKP